MTAGRDRVPALLLLALTLVGYGRLVVTPGQEFVFDDVRFVERNEAVHDLGNAARFFTDPTTVDPVAWRGIYRPLRTLDFAIDWAIAGPRPWWFHLRNAVLHAVSVLLLVKLLGRWGAGRAAAFLGAGVFALHPVQVEAVGWISSRGDVLCLALFLLALLLHDGGRRLDLRFAGAAASLGLALLAKEAAVVFPAAAILTDFFFRDERRLGRTLARWPRYAVYVAVVALYVALRFEVHGAHGGGLSQLESGWGALIAVRGFVDYARLILLPVDMVVDPYLAPVRSLDLLSLACLAAVLCIVGWAVVRALRSGGATAFAVLWFVVTILPVSNLLVPLRSPTAERFLYLPMVGVALPAGLLLARIAGRRPLGVAAVCVFAACVFSVTFARTGVWLTSDALWEDAVRRHGSFRAHFYMARRRAEEGRADEANHHFERGIEELSRLPETEEPVLQFKADHALRLVRLGRPTDGLDLADEVLERWPDLAQAHHARAAALFRLDRLRDACGAIEAALGTDYSPGVRRTASTIYRGVAGQYEREGNLARRYHSLLRSWDLWPDQEANGEVMRAIDRIESDASQEARRAISMGSEGTREGRLAHAIGYARHGQWEVSGPRFERLLGERRDAEVLLPYALHHWQWRDTEEGYREAVKAYEEILGKWPDSPEATRARAELAKCREALGER
ncbi:MAG: hypothetical protein ACYTDY_01895 [Planctomycetota bacterium]